LSFCYFHLICPVTVPPVRFSLKMPWLAVQFNLNLPKRDDNSEQIIIIITELPKKSGENKHRWKSNRVSSTFLLCCLRDCQPQAPARASYICDSRDGLATTGNSRLRSDVTLSYSAVTWHVTSSRSFWPSAEAAFITSVRPADCSARRLIGQFLGWPSNILFAACNVHRCCISLLPAVPRIHTEWFFYRSCFPVLFVPLFASLRIEHVHRLTLKLRPNGAIQIYY